MMQTWENGKNPNFGANLGTPIFFSCVLPQVSRYHPMQFLGKAMNQTWENNQKPNFGPEFGMLGAN